MRVLASTPNPGLLTLPWGTPLERWSEHVVPVPRGLSRHVVRVIHLDGVFYAVKETQEDIAKREYRLLRDLGRRNLPAVVPVAVVSERPADLGAALVTRHLAFALPYRAVFANGLPAGGVPLLVDALVVLLVRLHLAGFYWGDVSLSNVLFRRSAGEFAAYLVDAETGEIHPELSPRMREYDVEVGCENVFAELLDLQEAEPSLADEVDPFAVIERIRDRYGSLWHELTAEEQFSTDEVWRIEQRVERLGDLGFDVAELAMDTDPTGGTVSIRPRVVEAGHHARELAELTGLEVEDNQARRLLTDLASYAAHHGITDRAAAGRRWRYEIYDPIAEMVPPELRGRLEPAEVFHQLLEHRWLLSERAGREIDIFETARDYLDTVLARLPEEKLTAPE
ncbi:DUF4032 domain-containing protein [Nocardioides pocheonensis]|uniref:DUF4032 domain-containing protein n=1 Tax=Nocardioides pocheonensis TaxID=661485 RepID=A0A3N0GJV7_9ACTN|nr:DUF4032 domain-containing protein [Nocardioides pocheonensis]RNM12754.1 DUF4032 domain-containing protein [Nocardioides pocheonensis]